MVIIIILLINIYLIHTLRKSNLNKNQEISSKKSLKNNQINYTLPRMIPNIDSNFPNPKNLITLIDNNIIKHSPIFQTQNQNILQIPTHPHPMIVPHSQPLKITTLQKPILIKNLLFKKASLV